MSRANRRYFSRQIRFHSGATMELTVQFNPFDTPEEDRCLINGFIDQFRELENSRVPNDVPQYVDGEGFPERDAQP